MKLHVRLGANSIEEKREAEGVILEYFSSRNSNFRDRRKIEMLLMPEDFGLKNYVFVYDEKEKFYSVLRYKWRKTLIGNSGYDSIITTDFCINGFKNQTVQKDLQATKLSLDLLASLSNGLILGDARKNLGSYYKFFGFEQIGNYAECRVEEFNFREHPSETAFKELNTFTSQQLKLLSRLKTNAESNQFISIIRSNTVWQVILDNEFFTSRLSIHALILNDQIAAYLILDATNSVIEFGEDPKFMSQIERALKNFLISNSIHKFNLDLSNSLFNYLNTSDKEFRFRWLDVKGGIARPGVGKSLVLDYCNSCSNRPNYGHFKSGLSKTAGILHHTSRISNLDWL